MKKTIQQLIPQISLKVLSTFLFAIILVGIANGQATINGKVIDEYKMPLMDVLITDGTNTTFSGPDGYFTLEIPADADLEISFQKEGHINYSESVNLTNGERYEFNDGKRGYEWLPKTQYSTKALLNYKGENTTIFYKFEYFVALGNLRIFVEMMNFKIGELFLKFMQNLYCSIIRTQMSVYYVVFGPGTLKDN